MKNKLKELGFTSGHAHLLLVAVALFAVLFVAQSNISLRALFANADDEAEMLTYEEVLNDVTTAYGGVSTDPEAEAEAERQLALLDRSLDNGQVLGEVVGLGTIPSVEQLYSNDQMNSIPVKMVPTNSNSLELYQRNISVAESNYDTANLLASLNGNDVQEIAETTTQIEQLISTLQQVSVPDELASFHRYKIMYYQVLVNLGKSFSGNSSGVDLQNDSIALFSLVDKITKSSSEIFEKYGVQL